MSESEENKKKTLNDLSGMERSTTLEKKQEIKVEYKVLENADLLFKKQYKRISIMDNADIMTKKEILQFLQDTYNTL